jgi:hypothetical protein
MIKPQLIVHSEQTPQKSTHFEAQLLNAFSNTASAIDLNNLKKRSGQVAVYY